jgi:hypothetical protein
MRFMYSDSHQLAPEGSRPPSPRAHEPDQEALRALAQSLRSFLPILYYFHC